MFVKRHAQTLLQTGTFQTVAEKGNFIQKRWVQLFVIIKTHSGSGLMWLTQQTVGATRYSIISTLSLSIWICKRIAVDVQSSFPMSHWNFLVHASIHQMFGTLLHVQKAVSDPLQKAVSDPLQLLLAVHKLLFQLCFWCHSQLEHALLVWYVLGWQTLQCFFQQLSKAFSTQNKSND